MTQWSRNAMRALQVRIWKALERRVSGLPPERWLRIRLAADAIERFAGRRRLAVLDAGSGDARLARLLAREHPGWDIVAADHDEAALRRARRSVAGEGLANVEVRAVDLCRPFDEGRYDAVASVEVLTEIEDDDAALACMSRALRSGGLLVVTAMDRDWAPVLRGSAPIWEREVRHGYSRPELVAKLERAGLQVTRSRPIYRTMVRLAEEISDGTRSSRVRFRALLYPILRAAAVLERRRLAAGRARGWLVEARRL
jgi:SAM-dependent methyltransferase